MRTIFAVLLLVAAVATLGSAAPGKSGKATQAGGRRKPTGQSMSTTEATSAALRGNATRPGRMPRLRREAGDEEESVVTEVPVSSTRKPRNGGGRHHGKGKNNGTAKAGGKRHGSRNQRDLSSLMAQAQSMFGGSAAGGKQPDLNSLMTQARSVLNSLGSQSQTQLNSMLQGSGISQSDISALISQGSSMLSSLTSGNSDLLGNLTSQLQNLNIAVPAGRKRRDTSEAEVTEGEGQVEEEGEVETVTAAVEESSMDWTTDGVIVDEDFAEAAEQASNIVSAAVMPPNGTMHGKVWWSHHHQRQQSRVPGLFDLIQPLMRGEWAVVFMQVQAMLEPLIRLVMNLVGPLLASLNFSNEFAAFTV